MAWTSLEGIGFIVLLAIGISHSTYYALKARKSMSNGNGKKPEET